jgi:hypothetical protein
MVPDVQQLCRIRDLAARAGLQLNSDDPDAFAARYVTVTCQGWQLPPAFAWLCSLCEPAQLSRIWIIATALGDPGPLGELNERLRGDRIPWPDYLVAFACSGDEVWCFAYNTPHAEPAVVEVNCYGHAEDADGQPYTDWHYSSDGFEQWLAVQADWLPQSDAKAAAWEAEFRARQRDAWDGRSNSTRVRDGQSNARS